MGTDNQAATGKDKPEAEAHRIRLDTTQAKTGYCNFFSVADSGREIVLNLGFSQRWDPSQKDVQVQLLHQVILHPASARQLQQLLDKAIREHEARHGAIA